jgi:endonuclease YncB( thermonuclease family)
MREDNRYDCLVLRVIDGDTFEAIVELGFGVAQKFKVRLDGIDTPEKNTDEGVAAKEFVRSLIEGKTVLLQDAGHEKYGRARAAVYLEDGTDLTELLIKERMGKEYHGEKKQRLAALTLI